VHYEIRDPSCRDSQIGSERYVFISITKTSQLTRKVGENNHLMKEKLGNIVANREDIESKTGKLKIFY